MATRREAWDVEGGVVFCVACGQPLTGGNPKFCASCGSEIPLSNGPSGRAVDVAVQDAAGVTDHVGAWPTFETPTASAACSCNTVTQSWYDRDTGQWLCKKCGLLASAAPDALPAPAAPAMPRSSPTSAASMEPKKGWLFVGLGIAALLVTLFVFGALNQDGETPPPPPKTDSVTDGLEDAQARWDASEYMQKQATCASWRSYSHDEFFALNPVPIEGRPLMTTLLDRNC